MLKLKVVPLKVHTVFELSVPVNEDSAVSRLQPLLVAGELKMVKLPFAVPLTVIGFPVMVVEAKDKLKEVAVFKNKTY